MLRLLKDSFSKLFEKISQEELTEEKIDDIFDDVEIDLLESNVSLEVIDEMREKFKEWLKGEKVRRFGAKNFLREKLREFLSNILREGDPKIFFERVRDKKPVVILVIGINGVGKTLTCGKLAKYFLDKGYSVVFSASDTFRAASIEQLEEIAKRLGVKVIKHKYGADPAAVAYDAVNFARSKGIDFVIIDSAGRLHTDKNLMEELKKIKRVVKPDFTILVVDSLTGNDAVNQAREFLEVGYDFIILTKFDVDEKGGTAISVSFVSGKPILFLGVGQNLDDLEEFSKKRIFEMLF